MTNIEKIFTEFPEKYVPGIVDKSLVYYFSIGDEKWTVFVDPEKCEAKKGKLVDNADCIVKSDPKLFENMVIKIQTFFRTQLAVRWLRKQVRNQRDLIEKKLAAQSGASSMEVVLTEFKMRLDKRHLTPEAFFRACDIDYAKAVPVSKFKAMLSNFKLNLSRA